MQDRLSHPQQEPCSFCRPAAQPAACSGLVQSQPKEARELLLAAGLAVGHPPAVAATLQAMRADQARRMQAAVARQVLEAISLVEARQSALMARQAALLQLCQQLLPQSHGSGGQGAIDSGGGGGSGAGAGEALPGLSGVVGGAECSVPSFHNQQQQQQHLGQQSHSVQAAHAALKALSEVQSRRRELWKARHQAEASEQAEEPLAPLQPCCSPSSAPLSLQREDAFHSQDSRKPCQCTKGYI